MEAHQPGARLLGAKAVFHQAIPDLARGAIFRDLFEEIVMRVEEEAEARTEVVYVESATFCPLHVLDSVVNGERQLLQRSGAGFADVVSADRNGVEFGCELGT